MAKLMLAHKDVEKRTVIEDFDIAAERPFSYPSKWFNANPGIKPSIPVMATADKRVTIHNTVREGFHTGKLLPHIAVAFLKEEFSRESAQLTADWVTCKIEIGKKDQAITIGDLVNYTDHTTTTGLVEGGNLMGDGLIKRYLIAVCSVYRIVNADRENQREELLEHIGTLMTQPQGEEIRLNQVYGHYKSWLSYQPFIKMMACIDMYLNEFPFHNFAQCRIGTIISRFKDCSVLLSTYLTTKYLGLKFEEFAPWIWTRNAAIQFARVVKGGEEMDNSRSYALYFRDFFLSDKSPYSAQLNPDLHLLYHTIGCSGSVVRCANARVVGNPEANNVIANAQVIHFVFGELPKFGMQFTIGGVPLPEPEDLAEVLPEAMPEVADAAAWLGFLQESHNKIPRIIKARAIRGWIGFNNARDKSIGEYLYKRANALNEELEVVE